jgi:hypothetical protein
MLERHLSSSERHVSDILKRNTVINKLKLKRTFVKAAIEKRHLKSNS